MVQTFDVNRIGGGTFELVQDPATGRYSYQKVGFNKVKSLTIPDVETPSVAQTDTAAAAKTATEQTVKQQTTNAFKIRQPGDSSGQPDLTGEMVKQRDLSKEAAKIDPQINARRLMTQDAAYNNQQRPSMLGDTGASMNRMSGTYQDDIMRGGTGVKADTTRGPGIFTDKKPLGSPFKAFDVTPKSGIISRPERSTTRPSGIDAPMVEQMAAPESKQTSPIPDRMQGQIIEREAPKTVLNKVNTGLKSLANSVNAVLSSGPVSMIANAMSGGPAQKNRNDFNKGYFNAREDGRIAGNPATDVFAGMNRESAFGDVGRGARNRISTREKTIERKGYGPGDKFYDDTQNMKDQLNDYQGAKNKSDLAKGPGALGPAGGATNDGGGSGGGGRVICTELNKTDELSTLDWVRDIRFTYSKLSKKHIKGYLVWAVPTVRHIKKYPTYRKIWKHIAQHRANDIAWRTKKGNFDLLGRIYAGIGEPLCWLIGNFVSDKQFDELHAKGKRAI
jgi:hypothetical protein